MNRERKVTWSDTELYRTSIKNNSGLSFVSSLADGKLPNPPFFQLLGFKLVKVQKGLVTAECEMGEHLYNAACVVHGGVVATLIDTTTALAVRSCLPKGSQMTSIELKLNFLKSLVKDSGKIIAIAEVIHLGRRVSLAESKVYTSDGKLVAIGTSSIARIYKFTNEISPSLLTGC
ncbi:MAG: PaaI family thioesterase [Betaproteobacteria bacterium]